MTITDISADVRIVNYGALEAFKGRDDIVVEERADGQWQRVMAFNSVSNDYASTESRDFARNLARVRLMAEAA